MGVLGTKCHNWFSLYCKACKLLCELFSVDEKEFINFLLNQAKHRGWENDLSNDNSLHMKGTILSHNVGLLHAALSYWDINTPLQEKLRKDS